MGSPVDVKAVELRQVGGVRVATGPHVDGTARGVAAMELEVVGGLHLPGPHRCSLVAVEPGPDDGVAVLELEGVGQVVALFRRLDGRSFSRRGIQPSGDGGRYRDEELLKGGGGWRRAAGSAAVSARAPSDRPGPGAERSAGPWRRLAGGRRLSSPSAAP